MLSLVLILAEVPLVEWAFKAGTDVDGKDTRDDTVRSLSRRSLSPPDCDSPKVCCD